jgi:hypothetical protein
MSFLKLGRVIGIQKQGRYRTYLNSLYISFVCEEKTIQWFEADSPLGGMPPFPML